MLLLHDVAMAHTAARGICSGLSFPAKISLFDPVGAIQWMSAMTDVDVRVLSRDDDHGVIPRYIHLLLLYEPRTKMAIKVCRGRIQTSYCFLSSQCSTTSKPRDSLALSFFASMEPLVNTRRTLVSYWPQRASLVNPPFSEYERRQAVLSVEEGRLQSTALLLPGWSPPFSPLRIFVKPRDIGWNRNVFRARRRITAF